VGSSSRDSATVAASCGKTGLGALHDGAGCGGREGSGSWLARGACGREVDGQVALGCASVGFGLRSTSSSLRCRCVL
jgi:hypothetical protein